MFIFTIHQHWFLTITIIMLQVSQIVTTTTLDGLWNFLTSTTLKQIMIMRWNFLHIFIFLFFILIFHFILIFSQHIPISRFVFFTVFAIVGMSILNSLGPAPFDITTLVGRWVFVWQRGWWCSRWWWGVWWWGIELRWSCHSQFSHYVWKSRIFNLNCQLI